MPQKIIRSLSLSKRLALNIEQVKDLNQSHISYFPTPQALNFVSRIANSAKLGGSAHALQGAYGAGKSSLAIFTLHQLACATNTFTPKPEKKNGRLSPAIKLIRQRGGLLGIPIVGAVSPLASRIASGLKRIANDYKNDKPAILKSLGKLEPNTVNSEQIMDLLTSLAAEIFNRKKAGLLLIIDEFDRHLERMIACGDLSDLHLLQNIAETTGNDHAPISLVILQHHGLEHYSRRFLSEQLAEWEKIRGRFTQTILSNTETDTAHIISTLLKRARFKSKIPTKKRRIKLLPAPEDICLSTLRDKAFIAASSNCSPIHPLTVVALARLARLLGQNDRTIISWLTSDVDTGFIASTNRSPLDWVYPADLYAHFFGDIQLIPSNPVLARRFAAIHSAYAKLSGQASQEAITLLQTISILNFCSGGGFIADLPTITICLPAHFPWRTASKFLLEKSLIVHRKHRNEYCVWEGSDYNIPGKINEASQQLNFSAAETLNLRAKRSALAHAHLVRTGNHRTAELIWLNPEIPAPTPPTSPRVLIWLDRRCPTSNCIGSNDVWGVIQISGLGPMLRETASMHYLLENDQSLLADNIATEEIKRQLEFLEEKTDALISDSLSSNVEWHLDKEKYGSLQQAVSKAMDETYPKALKLHNELINRTTVSGPVTSAIRKLVERIYTDSENANLGIDKFPAERIIYESLLKNNRIHIQGKDKKWRITLDPSEIDSDLVHIIEEIQNQLITTDADKPTELNHVLDILAAPPYGIKRTPALLLCLLFLLVHNNQTELYEDRLYLPYWGPQTLVRMLRAPTSFAVALSSHIKLSQHVLNDYRLALANNPGAGAHTPINLARDLLLRYERLSAHAQQTDEVPEQARKFRRAISVAKSPVDMLFRTIPAALGHSTFPTNVSKRKKYFKQISQVWAKLENSDSDLKSRFKKILLQLYDCSRISQARSKVINHTQKVTAESKMYHAQGQFLDAITGGTALRDGGWLKYVMNNGLGIHTPVEAWNDSEAAHAEITFRQHLIGLRQAVNTLEGLTTNEDTVFVVWCPPPDTKYDRELKRLKSHFKRTPKEQIMPQLLGLINHFNKLK